MIDFEQANLDWEKPEIAQKRLVQRCKLSLQQNLFTLNLYQANVTFI